MDDVFKAVGIVGVLSQQIFSFYCFFFFCVCVFVCFLPWCYCSRSSVLQGKEYLTGNPIGVAHCWDLFCCL